MYLDYKTNFKPNGWATDLQPLHHRALCRVHRNLPLLCVRSSVSATYCWNYRLWFSQQATSSVHHSKYKNELLMRQFKNTSSENIAWRSLTKTQTKYSKAIMQLSKTLNKIKMDKNATWKLKRRKNKMTITALLPYPLKSEVLKCVPKTPWAGAKMLVLLYVLKVKTFSKSFC